jgi:hypothetical protein
MWFADGSERDGSVLLDSPFEWLVGYNDPRHPEVDPLHEWQFRSGLDRYIWIWGMICAYMHPAFERALNWLDSINQSNAAVIRAAIVAGACSSGDFDCIPQRVWESCLHFIVRHRTLAKGATA